MSVQVSTLVWQRYAEGGSKKMLLLAMADRADEDGSSCYESVSTLATKCRLNVRQVQRLLRDLESEKVVAPYAYVKGGGRNPTHYRVCIDVLLSMPTCEQIDRAKKLGVSLEDVIAIDAARGDAHVTPEKHQGRHSEKSGATSMSPDTLTTDINKNNNKAREDFFDEQPTKKPRKRFSYEREMPLPDDFCVTAELYAWADKRGFQDIDRHLDHFIAHHGAKGSRFKDWQYAYQNWVINDKKFAANRQATNQQRQSFKSKREEKQEKWDEVYAEYYGTSKPAAERDSNTIDIFETGDFLDAEFVVVNDKP